MNFFTRLVVIVVLILVGFLYVFVIFYKMIRNRDEVTEIKVKELVLICLTLLVTGIISAFVVHKRQLLVYLKYIYYGLLYHVLQSVAGSGFYAGFMTTAKLGYVYYLFVVPRFVFDNFEDSFFLEHHQKRVASMSSFVIGQLVMFLWVYCPGLRKTLIRPDSIFLLFMLVFVIQVLWVRLTIVRNWKYLYPRDKRKRVVRRVVLLQVEFMCNFFLQLALLPSNSYIEPQSRVYGIVKGYLKAKGNPVVVDPLKKVFLQTSFLGWLIAHICFMIFYIKFFELILMITIWIINRFRKS